MLEMMREFYASDAVLHPLPPECHTRNLEEMCRPDGMLAGYFFEDEDGRPAGFAMVALGYSTEAGGRVAWIEDVYVRPAYRSQGFGRAFFARLEQDYAGTVRRFRLEVERSNTRAVALYERLGFTELPYRQMIRDL